MRSLTKPTKAWFALSLVIWMCITISFSGCSQFILLSYLIAGRPSITPDYESVTKQSMTDYEVVVAVVCYAPDELKWDFESLDHDIAKAVSFRMQLNKIKIINPDSIRSWTKNNPNWDKPEEIGEAFNATHVVYIDMLKYSLYEESSRRALYRGRGEALVSVYEMSGDGTGERIYSKEITSVYPTRIARSTDESTYASFRKEYQARISEEIGRLFYPHYSGDDIGEAT